MRMTAYIFKQHVLAQSLRENIVNTWMAYVAHDNTNRRLRASKKAAVDAVR